MTGEVLTDINANLEDRHGSEEGFDNGQTRLRVVGGGLLKASQANTSTSPRRSKSGPSLKAMKIMNEKPHSLENSRLHSLIVPAEEIPLVEFGEEVDPIQIHITSDNTITLNGQEIALSGDHLFVFNALMMLRDKSEITASDIQALGFRSATSGAGVLALSAAIEQTREQLQGRVGSDHFELIASSGEGDDTAYIVNAASIITDLVREGSVVTVDYLDGEEDSQQTFRIANRHKQHDPGSSIRLISSDQPLSSQLLGAKRNEIVEYTNALGETVELQVIDIK